MADACCGGVEDDDAGPPLPLWRMRPAQLAALAGVLLAAGFLAGLAGADRVELLLEVAAAIAGGATFVPETIEGLAARRRPGVGLLMTIGGVGAILLGQIGEAASLAFLFSISEALEGYALTKARHGLRALLSLVPDTAIRRRGSSDEPVSVDDLVRGDLIVIRAGDRVPTDGTVVEGRTAMDLSAVTGESVPVETGPGAVVNAGALNGNGVVVLRVDAPVADSTLARIVRTVEEAQEAKSQDQRLADRVARPLVPTILVTAAAVAAGGSLLGDPEVWLRRSIVLLVAASPCALAIAVPVTVIAAVAAASRAGSIVKGGRALEALAGVRVVALDKTGTITQNKPAVVAVIAAAGHTDAQVLAWAAALEAASDHPLAAAITAAASGHPSPAASDVETVPGHGITGTVDGQTVKLGKPAWLDPGLLADRVADLQYDGATVVVVHVDDEPVGLVAVRDELRIEAADVIGDLHRLGYRHVVMLTGDNERTAQALGRRAGVDSVEADLLPDGKVDAVTRLAERGPVAMVGDGINDAPALATAHAGIAIGALGNDAAIEAADAALLGGDLHTLPELLAHSRRAGRIMRQNLLLSLAVLTVLIPLAGTGTLGLATTVATHELAEVLVILNGLRAGLRRRVRGRKR